MLNDNFIKDQRPSAFIFIAGKQQNTAEKYAYAKRSYPWETFAKQHCREEPGGERLGERQCVGRPKFNILYSNSK